MLFLYILYLIDFTINDFVFSITHSGFNQKIITPILDIVFITRSRIFLSEIHLKLAMDFWSSYFLLVDGQFIGSRCTWSMVGWWMMVGR